MSIGRKQNSDNGAWLDAMANIESVVSREEIAEISAKAIEEIRAIAAPIAERHGVNALYLFGSYARGEATPASDMDFRIEKNQRFSLFQLAALQLDLENSFQKSLDVLTTQMLSPQFLRGIQPEEVLVYASH